MAQSAATSRAYAAKFDDEFDENVDLVGLAVANIGAGLTGTFVVNGSPTKTAMVDDAGGRSQLAQLVTAAVVLVVLLVLTRPLSYMPEAVLAAVVFLIGVKLVDVKGMREVLRRRPVEFAVALATTVIVVFVGVEQGIILAILLAIVAHTRHSYMPYDRLLVRGAGKIWTSLPLESGAQARPGLLMYRFGSSLYYANASRFADEVRGLLKDAGEPIRWFCLVAETMDDLDYTGSAVLKRVLDGLAEGGHHVRRLRRPRAGPPGARARRPAGRDRQGARLRRHRRRHQGVQEPGAGRGSRRLTPGPSTLRGGNVSRQRKKRRAAALFLPPAAL